MSPPALRAGTLAELSDPAADWLFIDVGFSKANRSTGWLEVRSGDWDQAGEALTFGEAQRRLVSRVEQAGGPLNVVFEAPLSAFFDARGNPVGRSGEKKGAQTRYWYAGLGCVVKVAALFLLQAVGAAARGREVRVFEGFVSFKDPEKRSDHVADVNALRTAVQLGHAELPGRVDGEPGTWISLLSFVGGDGSALPPIITAR